MKKQWRRMAALCLTGLLAVGLSACNREDAAWAYKTDGETMPVGVYLLCMLEAYGEAEERYLEDTYADAEPNEVWIYPDQEDLLVAPIEGKAGGDWIHTRTGELVQEYFGTLQLAREQGLELSGAGKAAAAAEQQSIWRGSDKLLTRNGISEGSLGAYLETQALKRELFLSLFGEGGQRAVGREELLDRMEADYIKISMMEFEQTKGDAASAKEQAEHYGQRLVAGEQVDALVYEYRLSQAEDPAAVQMPEKANWQLVMQARNIPEGDAFYDAVQAAEPGTSTVLEYEGYQVAVYRHDLGQDQEAWEQLYETVLWQMKRDELSGLLRETAQRQPIEQNTAALERYTPWGLVMKEA